MFESFKIFWMNNEAIILLLNLAFVGYEEFCRSQIMLSTSTLTLTLTLNSSYPTQPHSIIPNCQSVYIAWKLANAKLQLLTASSQFDMQFSTFKSCTVTKYVRVVPSVFNFCFWNVCKRSLENKQLMCGYSTRQSTLMVVGVSSQGKLKVTFSWMIQLYWTGQQVCYPGLRCASIRSDRLNTL